MTEISNFLMDALIIYTQKHELFLLYLTDWWQPLGDDVTRCSRGLSLARFVMEADTKPSVIPADTQAPRHPDHNTNHVADARLGASYSTAPAPRGLCRNSDPLRSQPHQRDSGTSAKPAPDAHCWVSLRCTGGECHGGWRLWYRQQKPTNGSASVPLIWFVSGAEGRGQQSRCKQWCSLLTAGQINTRRN